jgi:hypothetical protein
MKSCFITLAAIMFLAVGSAATAQDGESLIAHVPTPDVEVDVPQVEVRAKAFGAARMRVLVQEEHGLRVVTMTPQDDSFSAVLQFKNLAELRYQFQVQGQDGRLSESKEFVVRKRSGSELEAELAQAAQINTDLRVKITQLENTVQGLRTTDPKVLAKQRNVEMAKVLVLLSQREREVAEAEAKLKQPQGARP